MPLKQESRRERPRPADRRHGPPARHEPVFSGPPAAARAAHLQRLVGNQATARLLRRPAPAPVVQRDYDDPEFEAKPYPASHKPPDFEYWVNSMWGEVDDRTTKESVVGMLKGGTTAPRKGADIDDTAKGAILDLLYSKAYQTFDWTSAEELVKEGSLSHQILPAEHPIYGRSGKTIAAGFHGTWRNPETLLKAHKGTVPTIERHGKEDTDTAGIQDYLKTIGIEKWHPFWFAGDITKRQYVFRNKQKDNELDTTISVAKSAKDSLDFPMIESMEEKDKRNLDPNGLPITTNYVYLVGVQQGFGTTVHMQKGNVFGEGEIATRRLLPDDHLGYVRYRRVHAGGSRNDGYRYDATFKDVMPGARRRNITRPVQELVNKMPDHGVNRADPSKFDFATMYARLKELGTSTATSTQKVAAGKSVAASGAKARLAWDDKKWMAYGVLQNSDEIRTAPTPEAKALRERKFLEGVRSVIRAPSRDAVATKLVPTGGPPPKGATPTALPGSPPTGQTT